jgi:SAM-dependent methyltransferase
MPRFGEQRLVRRDIGFAHRTAFRLFGVAEPAHYLHHVYLKRALGQLSSVPTSILDAGCGSGDHTFDLARRFPAARVLGVDVDESLIRRNQMVATSLGLRNVSFRVASITEPLDGPFDLIVSIDVLEHLKEQPKALRAIRDALSEKGVAFFHIPTARPRPVPFSRWLGEFHAWAEEEHVADDLTAEQFEEAVTLAGFALIRSWRTFGHWSGELATSLFAIPFRNTPRNRIAQLTLAPLCRVLVMLDPIVRQKGRYALALLLGRG